MHQENIFEILKNVEEQPVSMKHKDYQAYWEQPVQLQEMWLLIDRNYWEIQRFRKHALGAKIPKPGKISANPDNGRRSNHILKLNSKKKFILKKWEQRGTTTLYWTNPKVGRVAKTAKVQTQSIYHKLTVLFFKAIIDK